MSDVRVTGLVAPAREGHPDLHQELPESAPIAAVAIGLGSFSSSEASFLPRSPIMPIRNREVQPLLYGYKLNSGITVGLTVACMESALSVDPDVLRQTLRNSPS
jgi:hypothetical protein